MQQLHLLSDKVSSCNAKAYLIHIYIIVKIYRNINKVLHFFTYLKCLHSCFLHRYPFWRECIKCYIVDSSQHHLYSVRVCSTRKIICLGYQRSMDCFIAVQNNGFPPKSLGKIRICHNISKFHTMTSVKI